MLAIQKLIYANHYYNILTLIFQLSHHQKHELDLKSVYSKIFTIKNKNSLLIEHVYII